MDADGPGAGGDHQDDGIKARVVSASRFPVTPPPPMVPCFSPAPISMRRHTGVARACCSRSGLEAVSSTGAPMFSGPMLNRSTPPSSQVSEIDAYWLQREVSRACGFQASDAETGRQLSEKVLAVLEDGDDRQVENRLVALLDVDKFDLIKLLVKNRMRVLWCTRLARAQDEPEARKVEATMAGIPQLASTLAQLHQQRMGARERQAAMESKIRDEARKLRADDAGAAAPSAAADKGASAGLSLIHI